jgi:Na+-transporting NADH:ubiquinone oxidoreductase subunit A
VNSIVDVPSKSSNGDDVRVISGSPLTGDQISNDGYLGAYHTAIALLAEGHEPKFLLTQGWLGLGLKRFSLSHSFPTWMMPKSKEWDLDTNMGGEERAFVVTGEYEKVFPMDIYPVHLVKSIMVNDIDSMEKLGIYEVAPEDFALCEYGCTSKIGVQQIVREGLDNLRNELG